MARKRVNTPEARRLRGLYIVAGIVFLLFMALNFIAENYVYVQSRDTYQEIINDMQSINKMTSELNDVNENVLLMVAGVSDDTLTDVKNSLSASFTELNRLETSYESSGFPNDMIKRRFTQSKYAIRAYQRKINETIDTLTSAGGESSKSTYTQEIAPLQAVAVEMLSATIDIGETSTLESEHNIAMQHGFSQGILLLLTILILVAMIVVGISQVNSLQEIREKETELDEQAERLDRTRQKMFDAAHMNILTGLNNRYALESTLEDLIGEVQFNIAVFDIDNFRAVNDQLGYEVGDEYLSTVAERLKEEYAENCDIYNISGNEFAVIFGVELSDMQAQQTAEQIRQMIGSPTMVAGVILQNSCSGALYHVLPNENMSITGLLMKLDSALHAAKRDGGNKMYYIQ